MIFWRKKNNITEQEKEQREESLLRRPGDPGLEPPTEYEAEMSEDTEHELEETSAEILDDLDETPVPRHTKLHDAQRSENRRKREAEQEGGGWLSRLTAGLSKSSGRLTQGIADLVAKKKLDQAMLDQLEELLITADLGPKSAAKVVEELARDRFGKDVTEEEIREHLAEILGGMLEPVAVPLDIQKPGRGPFTVLVCGVNGAGKTTTIGKFAHHLVSRERKSVVIAAGDTFRAAAVEQLAVWARRAHCRLVSRDVGADAAAVAYEAYEKAVDEKTDVLLIDTAGRLQNKANLMAELEKIIRVLKKRNDSLPHATVLVLDATTGQNAFSQVETFRKMVDVTGLIVTKLDGSAKGGVLVGLADRFGLPVHAIGIGEGIEDMQPFSARQYARSLVGLPMDEPGEEDS